MALTSVQQTLFFPLRGRAVASQRWPELFPDPWAAKATSIRELEGSTAEQLDDFSAAVYGLRHKLTVIEIKRYFAEHRGAAVVNIGCGLDHIVHEISSPRFRRL